jgi:phosphoglycerate dehydrogenase-like enzyme
MDLCDPLPVSMTDPMLDAPRTVLTPHMAWQTSETFRRAASTCVENILNYFRGEPSHVANQSRSKFRAHDQAAPLFKSAILKGGPACQCLLLTR